MTIYLSEKAAAAAGLVKAKRGRATRPDIPSAGRAEATGLSGLIAATPSWSVAYVVGRGYRLYVIRRPELDTGWHATEKAACDAAKGLK